MEHSGAKPDMENSRAKRDSRLKASHELVHGQLMQDTPTHGDKHTEIQRVVTATVGRW